MVEKIDCYSSQAVDKQFAATVMAMESEIVTAALTARTECSGSQAMGRQMVIGILCMDGQIVTAALNG